jgi:hypothetical protein
MNQKSPTFGFLRLSKISLYIYASIDHKMKFFETHLQGIAVGHSTKTMQTPRIIPIHI